MAFYKLKGDSVIFQLINYEVKEDFSIWDNKNKKFLRQMAGVNDFNELKFMQKDFFNQKYPDMTKKTAYMRHIMVFENNVGIEYDFGFSKMANEQIEAFVMNAKALKQNPLAVRLMMKKTGSGLQTEYKVTALETVAPISLNEATKEADKSFHITPPLNGSGLALIKPKSQELVLDDEERQVLDLFKRATERYSEDQFIEIFNLTLKQHFNTLRGTERIRDIFMSKY